jgi:hypothetical protein
MVAGKNLFFWNFHTFCPIICEFKGNLQGSKCHITEINISVELINVTGVLQRRKKDSKIYNM